METFWNTIAQYNESTWWAQILITAAGILLTALLYRRPTVWTKRSMKIYMVFLNGWIALVYYAMYCDTRNYHYVLSAFWGTVALIWLWDLFTGYTPFERNPKYPMLAGVLYAMPPPSMREAKRLPLRGSWHGKAVTEGVIKDSRPTRLQPAYHLHIGV